MFAEEIFRIILMSNAVLKSLHDPLVSDLNVFEASVLTHSTAVNDKQLVH